MNVSQLNDKMWYKCDAADTAVNSSLEGNMTSITICFSHKQVCEFKNVICITFWCYFILLQLDSPSFTFIIRKKNILFFHIKKLFNFILIFITHPKMACNCHCAKGLSKEPIVPFFLMNFQDFLPAHKMEGAHRTPHWPQTDYSGSGSASSVTLTAKWSLWVTVRWPSKAVM